MPGDRHPGSIRQCQSTLSGRTTAFALFGGRLRTSATLEDRPRLLGIVDDERERRAVAPAAQEQVAVDVDARRRRARARAWPCRPAGRRPRPAATRPRSTSSRPSSSTSRAASSSAVVMIMWPRSPMPPPPIARRSTPRAAICSARFASWPGWLVTWTTNCLGIGASGLGRGARDRDGTGSRTPGRGAAVRAPRRPDRSALRPRLAGGRSRAGTPRGSAARRPVSQRKSTAMPRSRSAAHAAGSASRSVAARSTAATSAAGVAVVEHEARCPRPAARRRRRRSPRGRRSAARPAASHSAARSSGPARRARSATASGTGPTPA